AGLDPAARLGDDGRDLLPPDVVVDARGEGGRRVGCGGDRAGDVGGLRGVAGRVTPRPAPG
ncbi:hypothetical protein JHN49_42750, partial [Streptomyces sp. MBT57]|nr:hypothetical protein [Streptomyces sp. MBT57]